MSWCSRLSRRPKTARTDARGHKFETYMPCAVLRQGCERTSRLTNSLGHNIQDDHGEQAGAGEALCGLLCGDDAACRHERYHACASTGEEQTLRVTVGPQIG